MTLVLAEVAIGKANSVTMDHTHIRFQVAHWTQILVCVQG